MSQLRAGIAHVRPVRSQPCRAVVPWQGSLRGSPAAPGAVCSAPQGWHWGMMTHRQPLPRPDGHLLLQGHTHYRGTARPQPTVMAPRHPVVPASRAGSSRHWLHSLAASPSEQGSSPSDKKEELVAERDDSEGRWLLPGDSQRSCSFASKLSITFSFSWSSRLSLAEVARHQGWQGRMTPILQPFPAPA